MYKIGDTFIADFHTWTITKIDEEGVSLEWDKYLISVSPVVLWVIVKLVMKERKIKNDISR